MNLRQMPRALKSKLYSIGLNLFNVYVVGIFNRSKWTLSNYNASIISFPWRIIKFEQCFWVQCNLHDEQYWKESFANGNGFFSQSRTDTWIIALRAVPLKIAKTLLSLFCMSVAVVVVASAVAAVVVCCCESLLWWWWGGKMCKK